ncbi:MAG: hypothetical protein ACRDIL_05545 [Candidatus Limnocylindrales bacterium]
MTTTATPTRITIDFHDSVHPSRSWIMGIDDRSPQRLELIAFDPPTEPTARAQVSLRPVPSRRAVSRPNPTALDAACACPEYCERDHANE